MEYSFREIESRWQAYWKSNKTFEVRVDPSKPKFYVLDMFPYPSGAGLHVGHPLGYIASDIYSWYKRLNGFNVLHPMGYDAFGLPAEQYAIQTGQHPAITTENNIRRYREQLDKIGFSYDWSREVRTCDPDYYHWTQWVFMQLFNHWYNKITDKAESIESLIHYLEKRGTEGLEAACSGPLILSAAEWSGMPANRQQEILLNYRLAYLAETLVNWCPALGTVLANDEVKEGFSVRGGHPVEQRKMKQWLLRVSAYAERLLSGLDTINWTDSLKEMQRNWIGKSEGANMFFPVTDKEYTIEIFTTRADTIYGATFMVLAPESELVPLLTHPAHRDEVEKYIEETRKRTERERIAEVKKITGVFTGTYAVNPFTRENIQIWIADYVLAGYGTGAIMAVPAHDSRDFRFALHFNLPIVQVVLQPGQEPTDPTTWQDSFDAKEGIMVNSGFLNGLSVPEAIAKTKIEIENRGIGKVQVNYRLRDAIFSRQRYWGEPFPVFYRDGLPYLMDEKDLPLRLPDVDAFLPTEKGEPPLARAAHWKTAGGDPIELSTMPGFAGSSAYYLRYMDPGNKKALVSREANEYWQDVDLYIGGTEHAVGHLIYSRFWNKFLFDTGYVCKDEPFKKLINQGMIQGRSNFAYRIKGTNKFVSLGLKDQYDTTPIHVDVNIVSHDVLDLEAFRNWNPEYSQAEFILENGKYVCGWAVEKMSKSMYNVVNPDVIIDKYGADTLRLYEMFLGPIEQSKPWDTNGIDGVHKFIKKLWRLFYANGEQLAVTPGKAAPAELKVLHRTIKKIQDDIERFSFNTSVSTFMICVNDLTDLKCSKSEILEPLLVLIAPFAPHLAEELWSRTGHSQSISIASWPVLNPTFLLKDTIEYPVSFNGKMRYKLELPADMSIAEIEKTVMENEQTSRYLQGAMPKKIVVVPKRIINIVY
ncbi:MAG: leucine--tRNA ligase [Bacteroidetes bacterium GWF2_49_14]|nr:MAG: leucine--tRNA ligase [Bacteroidetes bacterium GWF2_49_14]HBB93468.1 leucine--tRNA ligase [Bacteroidales bacterium]